MSINNRSRHYVHAFNSLKDIPFSPLEYSKLKFGSDSIAKKFGTELATSFFNDCADALLSSRSVVIPSPYNFVPNAASIMTMHFINRLNYLLVNSNGEHVDTSLIHRKVSYVNDYGFLPKEKRKSLIDNDSFYLNKGFTKGKNLIFIDDVMITGTHENKLREILDDGDIKNRSFFLYYAKYTGNRPDIEAEINFAGIKSMEDYLELSMQPNHHLIVRPIKFLLGQTAEVFESTINKFDDDFISKMYNACLGEGYYKIPSYQENFRCLSNHVIF